MSSIGTRVSALLLAAALTTQTGCYDWEAIKPMQASRLSDSFVAPVEGSRNVVAVRVVSVERLDGTLAQFKGDFDVRVTFQNHTELTFEHPVQVEDDGFNLRLRGGNRGWTEMAYSDVRSVEVSQLSVGKTVALGAGIPLVAMTVAMVLILSSANSKSTP